MEQQKEINVDKIAQNVGYSKFYLNRSGKIDKNK